MNPTDVYLAIRAEIVVNHVLMHLVTLVVFGLILVGIWWTEARQSVLSVFLPLLSLAWGASIVRFDYFIQRQGAYLRDLEAELRNTNPSIPLWETWKAALGPTQAIVPVTDVLVAVAIVVPTGYLLFGPGREYLRLRGWKGSTWYPWTVLTLLLVMLLMLAVIPYLMTSSAIPQ